MAPSAVRSRLGSYPFRQPTWPISGRSYRPWDREEPADAHEPPRTALPFPPAGASAPATATLKHNTPWLPWSAPLSRSSMWTTTRCRQLAVNRPKGTLVSDKPTRAAAATYADRTDADQDDEVVRGTKHAGPIDHLAIAFVERDAEGKLKIDRYDSTAKHLAWGGAVLGGALAVISAPPRSASSSSARWRCPRDRGRLPEDWSGTGTTFRRMRCAG